jgi:hypothetical protein
MIKSLDEITKEKIDDDKESQFSCQTTMIKIDLK